MCGRALRGVRKAPLRWGRWAGELGLWGALTCGVRTGGGADLSGAEVRGAGPVEVRFEPRALADMPQEGETRDDEILRRTGRVASAG